MGAGGHNGSLIGMKVVPGKYGHTLGRNPGCWYERPAPLLSCFSSVIMSLHLGAHRQDKSYNLYCLQSESCSTSISLLGLRF